MADISAYDAVIVDEWAPRMEEILDNTQQLTILMEKSDDFEVVESDEFRVPLHVSRNEGIGSRSEKGTLAAPGSQGVAKAVYSPKYTWGQLTITEALAELADKDEQKFLKELQGEFEGLINDVGEDRDRQFWGDGTGLLGSCGTTTATTTVTMGSAADMKFIRKGMRIDILTKADGTVVATDRKVTSIASATTFVIDGAAVTTDSNDGVYRQGNSYASGGALVTNECDGIQKIIDDANTVGGIDPTTDSYWKAGDFGSIGTLAEEEVQKAWEYPAENGYRMSPPTSRFVISDHASRRQFGKLLQTQKQYVVPTQSQVKTPKLVAGGFDALEYNGSEWLADRKCPAGHAYIGDKNHLNLYQLIKPGWKKRQGKVLVDDGGTGYVAKFRVGEQLGTNNRPALARLTGITAAP